MSLKSSWCPLEAFLPKKLVLELFITLLWYLPGWILEAWSKHENTRKVDRDVMKAGDNSFIYKFSSFHSQVLKNVGNWLRKTPVARKRRTTHFPPKWSSVIKIYLSEIKRDFLDRTVYWFISLLQFPSGKHASVWAGSVECRGTAPAPWAKPGQLEMCCKEAFKGEKNCLCCQWVILRPNARFSTGKKKPSWQQVDNSVKFIWRVFWHCCVLKCLNHGLAVN